MRLTKLLLGFTATATFALAGCSSSTTDPGPGGPQGGGQGGGGSPAPGGGSPAPNAAAGSGTEKNPYGVDYPTVDLGNTRGTRMRNFKFLGYVNGDKAQGLKTVSLADYFDPEMRQYKVVHLIASSVWCAPCNQETREAVAAKAELAAEKVVFVQALIDGPTLGTGATQGDLDQWVASHGIPFTVVLDPGVKNFGEFFIAGGVPWNANLDARSMEILSVKEGAPPDIRADVRRWTKWVDENPAKK